MNGVTGVTFKWSRAKLACNFTWGGGVLPSNRVAGFYIGFIIQRRSPEWLKATSFLGGSGGMLPRKIFENEYALRPNLVHFETIFSEMLQCVH